MEDKNNIALSVRDLKTFFYTNNRCNKAVNGVSFDVEKGKTLCIVVFKELLTCGDRPDRHTNNCIGHIGIVD